MQKNKEIHNFTNLFVHFPENETEIQIMKIDIPNVFWHVRLRMHSVKCSVLSAIHNVADFSANERVRREQKNVTEMEIELHL